MALFKNMAITNKGMALFTKAQAGAKIIFTKMRVGSGDIGTQNPAALTDLVDGKLDVPISSITPMPEKKSATIIGNINNSGLEEPVYICEIGIYAEDPDEGEILYGYSNSGNFGDYYAPESQGPYSWQYQIAVAIGNAANVTVELAELNFDYAVINTNTTFMILSGGNQKEINKAIDTKLKSQGDSITNLSTQVTKNTDDISGLSTQMADKATDIDATRNTAAKSVTGSINELKSITDNLILQDDNNKTHRTMKMGKDAEGIFTVVEKRTKDSSSTLISRSVLSGGVSPLYTTRTVTHFKSDGIAIDRTDVYALTYDPDGALLREV